MDTRTIGGLVEGLRRIPEVSFTRERVLAEFGRTVLDPASLHPYMFFSSTHYTRNLVYRDDLFEVIALGWERGQSSMIHNHRGQECWMGVPIGRLEVQNYRLLEFDPEKLTCLLERSTRYVIDPTHSAAVDPGEPIHSVHNLDAYGARAVSIHVYSRPFDSCMVYQPELGRCYEAPLDYTSRYGELCAGERAEPALT